MNRDTLTGIIGAVVLVAAMIGVFQYERSIGAARAGIGDGAAVTILEGPTAEGQTDLGDSTEATLAFNATGMVNVTLSLRWTAAQGEDTLRLEVVPPDGVDAPEAVSSPSGTISISVPVANDGPDGTVGVGDWVVRVTFESASGLAPPPAPQVGGDGNVAWTLETSIDAWTPVSG